MSVIKWYKPEYNEGKRHKLHPVNYVKNQLIFDIDNELEKVKRSIIKKLNILVSQDDIINSFSLYNIKTSEMSGISGISFLYKLLQLVIENNLDLELEKIINNDDMNYDIKIELEDGNLFNLLKNSIDIEKRFLLKIISKLENMIDFNKHNIILFDIDDTFCYSDNDTGKSFVRPSLEILIKFLKKKYGNCLDFGILSSRSDIKNQLYNEKYKLSRFAKLFNSNYIYSSRNYSQCLDNKDYFSTSIRFPDGYNEKINALLDIKSVLGDTNKIILIDDIIEGGKLEDIGEGISVFDCIFSSKIIGI